MSQRVAKKEKKKGRGRLKWQSRKTHTYMDLRLKITDVAGQALGRECSGASILFYFFFPEDAVSNLKAHQPCCYRPSRRYPNPTMPPVADASYGTELLGPKF